MSAWCLFKTWYIKIRTSSGKKLISYQKWPLVIISNRETWQLPLLVLKVINKYRVISSSLPNSLTYDNVHIWTYQKRSLTQTVVWTFSQRLSCVVNIILGSFFFKSRGLVESGAWLLQCRNDGMHTKNLPLTNLRTCNWFARYNYRVAFKAHSFPWASLLENCSHPKRDNVSGTQSRFQKAHNEIVVLLIRIILNARKNFLFPAKGNLA